MALLPVTRTLRVEVSDARADRRPRPRSEEARAGAEGGYGLVLVAEFARAWGVAERCVGKTVWAEIGMPAYCSFVTPGFR
ncbi:hypothetical protein ACM614_18020 [Streptomyces sp. 12297]